MKVKLDDYEVRVLINGLVQQHRSYDAETNGQIDALALRLYEIAEAMFSRLVKQLSEKEGVTEALKAENQMLWVGRMNNIRSAAMESVANDLIYC